MPSIIEMLYADEDGKSVQQYLDIKKSILSTGTTEHVLRLYEHPIPSAVQDKLKHDEPFRDRLISLICAKITEQSPAFRFGSNMSSQIDPKLRLFLLNSIIWTCLQLQAYKISGYLIAHCLGD